MMLLNKLAFPTKEGSINGVFRQLGNLLNSSNIEEDKIIGITCTARCPNSTYLITSRVPNSYWSIKPSFSQRERWFKIDFKDNRFVIDAYSIYNYNIEDYHKYWEILISNNNVNWTKIHIQYLESIPKSTTNTYYPTKSFPAKYVQMKVNSDSFGYKDNRFALYGFDLFGTLFIYQKTCLLHTTNYHNLIVNILLIGCLKI